MEVVNTSETTSFHVERLSEFAGCERKFMVPMRGCGQHVCSMLSRRGILGAYFFRCEYARLFWFASSLQLDVS